MWKKRDESGWWEEGSQEVNGKPEHGHVDTSLSMYWQKGGPRPVSPSSPPPYYAEYQWREKRLQGPPGWCIGSVMRDRANRAWDNLTEYPQTHRQKYFTSLDDSKEPGPVAEGELDVMRFLGHLKWLVLKKEKESYHLLWDPALVQSNHVSLINLDATGSWLSDVLGRTVQMAKKFLLCGPHWIHQQLLTGALS